MTLPEPIPSHEPPSRGKLLRSTLIAALVATAILVTIVLPAEYGVDPTGIGRVLGLKEMGEIKMRLAAENAAADTVSAPEPSAPPSLATSATMPATNATWKDVNESVLAPGAAAELKLVMRKGAIARFAWSTNRGVVNYDTHADAPGIRYHPYAKGSGVGADSGSLTAAFDGQHGWFWRNRGADTVTVTLRTSGDYSEVKRVQ